MTTVKEKAKKVLPSPSSGNEQTLPGRNSGLKALFLKELADHLTSRRFLIILVLIYGTCLASLYGALSGLSDAAEAGTEYLFLELYTTSGNSIPSFLTFIGLLGPFLGLTLGFDAINSERMGGTLNRLAAQPIYRDSIIIGKFLAGAAVIASIIANAVYPVDNEWNAMINSLDNYTLELNINRISPYYLFSEASATIMNPSIRSINVVTVNQLEGAVTSYLSLGQSLLLVWPHLTGLIAMMLISFAGSFCCFMRQEIRAQ